MNKKELLHLYKNIAIIGVTEDEQKYGYQIFKRLLDLNYNVFGISPKYKEVLNQPLYTSLTEIAHPIDLVVFVVNKKFALDYIKQMCDLDIGYAWMQPGTYDDALLDNISAYGIEPILGCILVETENM